MAATQPNTMLKTTPSIHTRTEFNGATENSPIQACEACHSGKTTPTARQTTNKTTSAADRPQPSATTLSGLLLLLWIFIVSSQACLFIGSSQGDEKPDYSLRAG